MKKTIVLILLLFLAFSVSLAAPKCDNPPCGQGKGQGPPCGTPPCGSSGSAYTSSDDVGLLPILLTPFAEPAGGISISINPPKTTKDRQVTLKLNAGPDAAKMTISNLPDMRSDGQENYSPTKKWDLCSKAGGFITYPACPSGTYTIYAKFYNQYGQASSVVSDSIELINDSKFTAYGGKSEIQLAQAVRLTQLQVIDLLQELIDILKNRIKSLSGK